MVALLKGAGELTLDLLGVNNPAGIIAIIRSIFNRKASPSGSLSGIRMTGAFKHIIKQAQ
jgi:hypothetical protein